MPISIIELEITIPYQVIKEINPDVVIHLAVANANRSNKDPFSTFDHSLRTIENVLDIIRNKDIHLIYFFINGLR